MVDTYGLTHVAVAVRNLEQTREFYSQIFGAIDGYTIEIWYEIPTPVDPK